MSGKRRRNNERFPVSRLSGRSRRRQKDDFTCKANGLEDKKYWISSVLRCLLRNKNQMELKKLKKEVENEYKRKYPDFETEIRRYSTLFRLEESYQANEDEEDEVNIIVSGRTNVRLCEKHCSIAGSCKSLECQGLHTCRFYILNECSFDPCHFGHEVRNAHNVQVLQTHLLHELSPRNVRNLLRDVRNRNETTLPKICNFYNVKKGCSREDCQFLHLCKRFVEEDCKFGHGCKRSHNWFDEQPVQVFIRYGICENDVNRVMKLIRTTPSKSMLTNPATGRNHTGSISHKNAIFYPSDQDPYYPCLKDENESKSEEDETFSISRINSGGRIKKEETIDTQTPKKAPSVMSPIGNTAKMETKFETMRYHGIQRKLQTCSLDLIEPNSNHTHFGPERNKRVLITNKNDEDDLVPSKCPKYETDSLQMEGELAAMKEMKDIFSKDGTENVRSGCIISEPIGLSVFKMRKCSTFEYFPKIDFKYNQPHIVKNDTHNSGKSSTKNSADGYALNRSLDMKNILAEEFLSKPNSASDDRLQNVKEIYLSTLSTMVKETDCPVDTQKFIVKRDNVNNETLWTFSSVDTLSFLHITPEIQDKLEKSYQSFQEQVRQCFIEAFDSRVHADLLIGQVWEDYQKSHLTAKGNDANHF